MLYKRFSLFAVVYHNLKRETFKRLLFLSSPSTCHGKLWKYLPHRVKGSISAVKSYVGFNVLSKLPKAYFLLSRCPGAKVKSWCKVRRTRSPISDFFACKASFFFERNTCFLFLCPGCLFIFVLSTWAWDGERVFLPPEHGKNWFCVCGAFGWLPITAAVSRFGGLVFFFFVCQTSSHSVECN